MTKLKAVTLLLGLALALPSSLWGEEKNDGKVNFTDLRDKRQAIAREIDDAQSEIYGVRERVSRIPQLNDLEGYLKDAKSRIEDLAKELEAARRQGNARLVVSLESQIRGTKGSVDRLEDDIKLRRESDRKVSEQQAIINKKQIELSGIESRIDDLLRRDVVTQNFKLMMSMTFAGLVLAVISGFFWIAYNDKRVRRTIFAGEAGIQFITLFSLVIAIILFGITGILGDKELSALLGGLSGYILGRSMNARQSSTPPTSTGTPGAATVSGSPAAGTAQPQTRAGTS